MSSAVVCCVLLSDFTFAGKNVLLRADNSTDKEEWIQTLNEATKVVVGQPVSTSAHLHYHHHTKDVAISFNMRPNQPVSISVFCHDLCHSSQLGTDYNEAGFHLNLIDPGHFNV